MSFVDRLKSRVSELAEETAEKMKDFVAEPELAEKRITICRSCPSYVPSTTTCKECGCFMVAKTKMNHAVCPLKKW